jgi:uncharacterized protein YuzE
MQDRYIEITFRKGKALAAYIYLSRQTGSKAVYTKKFGEGIIVDFDDKNKVIGLEVTSPVQIHTNEINEILNRLHIAPISELELAPLKAA